MAGLPPGVDLVFVFDFNISCACALFAGFL